VLGRALVVNLGKQVDWAVEKGTELKINTDQKSPLEGGKGGENVSASIHPAFFNPLASFARGFPVYPFKFQYPAIKALGHIGQALHDCLIAEPQDRKPKCFQFTLSDRILFFCFGKIMGATIDLNDEIQFFAKKISNVPGHWSLSQKSIPAHLGAPQEFTPQSDFGFGAGIPVLAGIRFQCAIVVKVIFHFASDLRSKIIHVNFLWVVLRVSPPPLAPLQGGQRSAGRWWWTSRKQVNLNAEKGTELKLCTDQKSPLAGGPRWAGRWS